jgi:hypothetical protein
MGRFIDGRRTTPSLRRHQRPQLVADLAQRQPHFSAPLDELVGLAIELAQLVDPLLTFDQEVDPRPFVHPRRHPLPLQPPVVPATPRTLRHVRPSFTDSGSRGELHMPP